MVDGVQNLNNTCFYINKKPKHLVKRKFGNFKDNVLQLLIWA